MIEVKIIKDSITYSNNRLTTFELKYHRFILSELNTHRVFSKVPLVVVQFPYQKC